MEEYLVYMGNLSEKKNFIGNFLKEFGLSGNCYSISPIKGGGSIRLFQRLKPDNKGETFILMENPPQNDFLKKENLAYLKIGNHMISKGIPLPKILRHDLENGYFILEDMGNRTIEDEVLKNSKRIQIYENIIETLLRLQIEGRKGFDTSWCCQTPYYDSSLMREKEAWYFRDSFLKDFVKTNKDLSILDESFEYIISMAEKAEKNFLLHRDFQSRNIMCRSKGIAILDWQGARLGPLAYDIASLLFDPYVDMSADERRHLLEVYTSLLNDIDPHAYESFKKYFLYIAVMRNLQVLGAFSFLSLKQGKTHFKKYIPTGLKSLKNLLSEIADKELSSLLNIIADLDEKDLITLNNDK